MFKSPDYPVSSPQKRYFSNGNKRRGVPSERLMGILWIMEAELNVVISSWMMTEISPYEKALKPALQIFLPPFVKNGKLYGIGTLLKAQSSRQGLWLLENPNFP